MAKREEERTGKAAIGRLDPGSRQSMSCKAIFQFQAQKERTFHSPGLPLTSVFVISASAVPHCEETLAAGKVCYTSLHIPRIATKPVFMSAFAISHPLRKNPNNFPGDS